MGRSSHSLTNHIKRVDFSHWWANKAQRSLPVDWQCKRILYARVTAMWVRLHRNSRVQSLSHVISHLKALCTALVLPYSNNVIHCMNTVGSVCEHNMMTSGKQLPTGLSDEVPLPFNSPWLWEHLFNVSWFDLRAFAGRGSGKEPIVTISIKLLMCFTMMNCVIRFQGYRFTNPNILLSGQCDLDVIQLTLTLRAPL